MCVRPHRLRVSLDTPPKVVPPVWGCPAFAVRETVVRWDVEGVCVRLWQGRHPASGARCSSGFGRWGDERWCPGEERDPHPPMVWLVVVEPPDPQVHVVLCAALFWGEECLELQYADVSSSMWEQGRHEALVTAEIAEVRLEGTYQVV